MKRKFSYLAASIIGLLLASSSLTAQSLSTGIEMGAGASYIIEDHESGNQIDYGTSMTAGANFKFTPNESYFGIRVNLLYVSTLFTSKTLIGQTNYGEVSTLTTSLLLEHLNQDKKLNLGYNFGMGYTREDYNTMKGIYSNLSIRNYMSLSVSGILSYQVSNKSSIYLTPTLLWTDPVNTFRPDNWYSGREDINVLVQLGYTYHLK
tara:strand:+ start:551 stop:1168 length:618 start_codon:yes stop_codon:yes gene_type:complete